MLSRARLLTPTSSNLAKLVAGSNTTPLTSVSAEFARVLPPAPPLPIGTSSSLKRKPIPIPPTPSPVASKQTSRTKEETREEEKESQDDDALKRFFLSQLNVEGGGGGDIQGMTVQQVIEASKERAGTVLENVALPYESTPSSERRVRTDGSTKRDEEEQDGIVIVAHVIGGENPKVNISSGFAVGGAQNETGEAGSMILTCYHTLNQVEGHLSKTSSRSSSTTPPSATFIVTSSGHTFTVSSILSSLPASDLLLLRLSPVPLDSSYVSSSSSLSPPPRLRSLPINPYPSPISSVISTHAYINPLTRLSRKLNQLPERSWQKGRIVEYKDSLGREAHPGTYDELSSFWTSSVPEEGSSGGPIVELESGSVVGVTRGSSHKYGERSEYGFATPSERILDMFALPGFKTSAQRQSERETREKSKVAEVGTEKRPTEGVVEQDARGRGREE
ncbi:uncharacterized protein JCM6883_006695 [Sporobolomyces salmoneus]|uniref:uncharacterized protein n=1 Tax=Sporobolomyces salmoneus TaxID=183962 RepID=UPI0031772909